jgi:hypothetical protein
MSFYYCALSIFGSQITILPVNMIHFRSSFMRYSKR